MASPEGMAYRSPKRPRRVRTMGRRRAAPYAGHRRDAHRLPTRGSDRVPGRDECRRRAAAAPISRPRSPCCVAPETSRYVPHRGRGDRGRSQQTWEPAHRRLRWRRLTPRRDRGTAPPRALADAGPIALIPLGTGNDLARSAGIPLDPAEAALVAVDGRHGRESYCWTTKAGSSSTPFMSASAPRPVGRRRSGSRASGWLPIPSARSSRA